MLASQFNPVFTRAGSLKTYSNSLYSFLTAHTRPCAQNKKKIAQKWLLPHPFPVIIKK
jgi:hypothetical protein